MSSVNLYLIAGLLTALAALIGWFGYRASQREAKSATNEIISTQTSSTEKILSELRARNKSLQDDLWRRYPDGYVLFGGGKDKNVVSLPFYSGDLQISADWNRTTLELDKSRHFAVITIPEVSLKARSVSAYGNLFKYEGVYAVGTAIPLRFIHVTGSPDMFFEVIDDNEASLVWVIGFKK